MPHHIGLENTDAKVAIICSSPERIPVLSDYFDNPSKLTDKRGFLIYQAFYHSNCILFVSTGIGGPSTSIAIEELIDLGIKAIIRVGTCGGLFPHVKPGHVVISSGAVRDEGTSRQYIDLSYPAIPDPYLLGLMIKAAADKSCPHHVGVTHCKDAYYMEKPQYQVDLAKTKARWQSLRNANVLATEMEAAILFVLGGIRQIITGALFINVGKVKAPEKELEALECIVDIIKESFEELLVLTRKVSERQDAKNNISFLDNDKG